MKKLVSLTISILLITGYSYAQNVSFTPKAKDEPGSLPKEAKMFLNKHFPNEKVVNFEKFDQIFNSSESDALDFDPQEAYEVELSNGIAIEFGKKGTMTEMESHVGKAIPLGALPDLIEVYLKANYSNLSVVSYDIDADNQEVELENGLDLNFDLDGRFTEKD